ncbi:MAG: hypothetical protein PHH60_02765 [Candidatus Margulisbacteria bacterium]|nr:hypothetical protein [Candidatus Margulisiibacteriota bacterium]
MSRLKNLFSAILSQDMAKQARQVEAITVLVFVVLLCTVWWLWQLKLDIIQSVKDGQTITVKMDVFDLLLSRNKEQ